MTGIYINRTGIYINRTGIYRTGIYIYRTGIYTGVSKTCDWAVEDDDSVRVDETGMLSPGIKAPPGMLSPGPKVLSRTICSSVKLERHNLAMVYNQ